MDKQAAKSVNKILKFLPKAAQAAVLFQNPPFSPGRDKRADGHPHKPKIHTNKGFSGPMLPMIPIEARGRSKNFEAQEPTSPKVSCIGQVKHKKRICQKQVSLPKGFKPEKIHSQARPGKIARDKPDGLPAPEMKRKPKPSGLKKMFSSKKKSDASHANDGKPPLPDRAPSLGQMRKFASSRDTFVNFDWTAAQVVPEEDRGSFSDEEEYSDGEDDVIVPFSAPILMAKRGDGAGLEFEPRKEINLWKRRTMAQPKPLQLDSVIGSGQNIKKKINK